MAWTRSFCPPARTTLPLRRPPPAIRISIVSASQSTLTAPSRLRVAEHLPRNKKPKPKKWRRSSYDRQLIDIVSGDLASTLEAHRASNRNAFVKVPYEEEEKHAENENRQQDVRSDQYVYREAVATKTISAPQSQTNVVSWAQKGWGSEDFKTERRKRLNIEIKSFAEYNELDQEEQAYRELLASTLCYLYESESLSDTHVQLFGSQRNGLATATSDIDIAFDVKQLRPRIGRGPSPGLGSPKNRKLVRKQASQFGEFLSKSEDFEQILYIPARFPLLKFRHKASGTGIQLVYCDPYHEMAAADLVRAYQAEYPQVQAVFFLLKAALMARSLYGSVTAGLGSYSLIMMIVASFKVRKLSHSDDLVEALSTFLSFYTEFDAQKFGIWVEPPEIMRKRLPYQHLSRQDKLELESKSIRGMQLRLAVTDKELPRKLCLQDPADPLNDLGTKCTQYHTIQRMIAELNDTLFSWLAGSTPSNTTNVNPIWAIVKEGFDGTRDYQSSLKRYLESEQAKVEIREMQAAMRVYESPGYQTSFRIGRLQAPTPRDGESEAMRKLSETARNLQDDLQEDMREYRELERLLRLPSHMINSTNGWPFGRLGTQMNAVK